MTDDNTVQNTIRIWWCFHISTTHPTRKITSTEFLTEEACKTLVQALVISRLDYANALLYGVPSSSLSRLQRVQHAAARLVMKARCNDHITTALRDLHWLPVRRRIKYKIILAISSSCRRPSAEIVRQKSHF